LRDAAKADEELAVIGAFAAFEHRYVKAGVAAAARGSGVFEGGDGDFETVCKSLSLANSESSRVTIESLEIINERYSSNAKRAITCQGKL